MNLKQQRRLAGVDRTLPGLTEAAKLKYAKVADVDHDGGTNIYQVVDPVQGLVKVLARGAKIDIQGKLGRRAHFRVWSSVMREIKGPSWNKLPKAVRQRVNDIFEKKGLTGSGRFHSPGAGLSEASSIMGTKGLEFDQAVGGYAMAAKSGHKNIDLAFTNSDDVFAPIPIMNSMLSFSWHELTHGVYEITAYLS